MLSTSMSSLLAKFKLQLHFPLLRFTTNLTYTSYPSSSCNSCYNSLVTSTSHEVSRTPPFSHTSLLLLLRSGPTFPEARRLHSLLLVHGYHQNAVLASQLVHVYVKLGALLDALHLFDRLPKKNSFAWNAVIKGLVGAERFLEALEFYHAMVGDGSVAADGFTYPLIIKACAGLLALEEGRRIQETIESGNARTNVFVQCALVDMFAKCGSLCEARRVFESMTEKDLATWGAMIGGTVQGGHCFEALSLFKRMRGEGFKVDSVIVATVVPACGRIGELRIGMALHGSAVRCGVSDDLCVSNALVDMYCKCGHIEIANGLFRSIKFKDVVSWSSLISGYAQNGMCWESIDLFSEMIASGPRPNSVTLVSILSSLSELKLIGRGKEIHCFAIRQGFELDEFIVCALIDSYSRNGLMREAELVFELMSDRDLAMWNSMVAGYAVNGDANSAFDTLRTLQKVGLEPDYVTIVSVLPVCNRLAMLDQGKELHAYVIRAGLSSAVSVNNSLMDMYCKCGRLELANEIFKSMTERDVVTYNTIIATFGMHGYGDEAIMFFDHMKKDGIDPDKVTFVALLSSCSHANLVGQGLYLYNSMIQDYDISPENEHYSCMVDLYSRSGKLDDAWNFIVNMPVEPEIDVLGCLLGACRVHKRMDIADLIGKKIFERQPEDPGYYILLSNIYADAGRWSDVTRVRTMIQERGLKKKMGNSWM